MTDLLDTPDPLAQWAHERGIQLNAVPGIDATTPCPDCGEPSHDPGYVYRPCHNPLHEGYEP